MKAFCTKGRKSIGQQEKGNKSQGTRKWEKINNDKEVSGEKRRMEIEKREEKEKSRGCLMCIPILPKVHLSKLRTSLLMSNPSLPSLSPLSYFLSHHNGKKKAD